MNTPRITLRAWRDRRSSSAGPSNPSFTGSPPQILVLAVQAAWTVLDTFSMAIFDLLRTAAQKTLYSHLYWLTEIVADLLLFSVIIALAHQATPEGPIRRKIDRLLAAAGGAMVLAVNPKREHEVKGVVAAPS